MMRGEGIGRGILAALAVMLPVILPGAAWAGTMGDLAFTQRQGANVPLDARFTDTAGRTLPLGAFVGGHPAILSIGYYACPNLCALEREDLLHALDGSGLKTPDDYTLIVVSIDPAETEAVARRARQDDLDRHATPGAERGWHFLVGEAASIGRLADAVGFHARYDPGLKQYLHPMGLVFTTPAGMVSGYVLGVGYRAGDVRQALARAAAGQRAEASPVLLLCFHYDAATGRYTLAVRKLLRLGAVMTVLVLGTLLGMAHWRRVR
ncbi:SCO family protein [Gluconacetobacter takamatsuzukensis]|uniref:SCO family protein n=1 Tax=Gluconacetobacter takamatsuzukensis TaxID=1286190 RepID=A0A7W4KBG4_9PROT|nr:SCO family protein [Gluconacetobacter takamatsuzukensis]MBB2203852.1 SCO family protein [Gluconacetobacter takamatsuzukensis]